MLSYAVTQRTRELGIRLALGAPARVIGQIVGQSLTLTLVGVGDRSPRGLGLTRLLRGLLFGVAPTDPAVFAAAALSPRRGGHRRELPSGPAGVAVDPMVALRSE